MLPREMSKCHVAQRTNARNTIANMAFLAQYHNDGVVIAILDQRLDNTGMNRKYNLFETNSNSITTRRKSKTCNETFEEDSFVFKSTIVG